MSRERPLVWLLQRTDAAGGVTVIVDALRPWLARNPWQVVKVVQRDQAAASAARGRPRVVRWAGDVGAALRLVARLLRERPDVVVTFTPAFGAAAALVARTWGGRTVVTHHGTRQDLGAVARGLDAFAWRMGAVDAVLACSQAVADSFAPLLGDRPAQAVVNGVPDVRDRAEPGLDRAALARRWGVPTDGRLAVAVGSLIELKNHAVVVDALGQAPGWRLVVAGEGPERAALVARAAAAGLADRVHLIGRVPPPTAWALMGVADAFVQPSFHEGMSLALLEALAMGAACLASAIAPNAEVLEPDAAGRTLPTSDAGAWAAALVALERDPAGAAEVRRRARAAYERRFGEERMLAGYEAAVAAVLARLPARRPVRGRGGRAPGGRG